jgi:hypothetical protein
MVGDVGSCLEKVIEKFVFFVMMLGDIIGCMMLGCDGWRFVGGWLLSVSTLLVAVFEFALLDSLVVVPVVAVVGWLYCRLSIIP